MSGKSKQRAFIVMPFGTRKAPDGTDIQFDRVYAELIKPAVEGANMIAHRADAEQRTGSIHADMFQDLLLAELVVADLTVDNPNVWYELGVRDALRSSGSVMLYAQRDRLPFDVAGQRMLRYTLVDGAPSAELVAKEIKALSDMIVATFNAWRGRRASPVYAQLPNLKEPDWKSLRVGGVNEFWQGLEAWQSRIEVASTNQQPADILVLADDTPNRVLEFDALKAAAIALNRMNRPVFALAILERARALDPDDPKCIQQEAIARGRMGQLAQAQEMLKQLSKREDGVGSRGETLGLLARTNKDEWLRLWKAHPSREADPVLAARETSMALRRAAQAYVDAFTADPADHYPGINGLTLGCLYEHVTGAKSGLNLKMIANGVRWASDCASLKQKDYWTLITKAELELLEGRAKASAEAYGVAVAQAVADRSRFGLDSSSQTLDFLGTLKFAPGIVADSARLIDEGEKQLDRLIGSRPVEAAAATEPAKIVLFSGHMIDDRKVRGPGAPKPPRFPAEKADSAAIKIAGALDEIAAGAGDLGICGGACGGDLLFAQACLARGMGVELRLAQPQAAFLRDSVTFDDPDRRWERAFQDVAAKAQAVLIMDDELGGPPEGVDKYDRCNRWMLYTALAHGVPKVSFVTLWDGGEGDGPGGTQHMANLVRDLTGRQPIVIDPKSL